MRHLVLRFTHEDDSQDLIEYALLAGFIALASVAMITNIGTGLTTVYTAINTQIQSAS